MIWIGLTGGMGCGKSTALKIFQDLNCGIESADKIVSELYKRPEVINEISRALDLPDNKSLEELKAEISKKVFNNPENLLKLESILHPLVRKKASEAKEALQEKGFDFAFYEIPLLFEKKLEAQFDKTLCIGANKETQIERIKKRNLKWSVEEIQNRLNSQISLEEKKRRSDFYIDNSGDLEELKQKCSELLSTLTSS